MRQGSYILYGCVPLRRSGSGFLICGVPFGQIHFQISDPSNPLWTRIHRITDLSFHWKDNLVPRVLRLFGQLTKKPEDSGYEIARLNDRDDRSPPDREIAGKRIRIKSLCTAVFALREESTSYMGFFSFAFPAFTRTALVVVSSRNLDIFLSEIHQKIDQMLAKYK